MRLCFQWCKLEVFNNLYADQKYLDYLSLEDGFAHRENFSDNLSARAFSVNLEKIRIKTEVDKILVECERLISYQFHGMRIDKLRIFTGINRFGKLRSKIKLFYLVYLPILGAIRSEMIRLKIDSGVCTSEAGKYDKSRLFENAKREKVFFLTFFYRTYKFLRLSEIPLIFIQFKR